MSQPRLPVTPHCLQWMQVHMFHLLLIAYLCLIVIIKKCVEWTPNNQVDKCARTVLLQVWSTDHQYQHHIGGGASGLTHYPGDSYEC